MGRAQQTRRQLQEAAVRLFAEKGYDNVTVEEIAAAVGVSHMTFFRHFPTKVSVLIDDPYDPVIGEMVATTDAELPPLERVRQGILESWAHVDEPHDDTIRTRFRLLTQHEDLVAAAWSNNRKTEQVIIDALTSTGVPILDARVAAGAVMGALMAALIDWGEREDSGTLGNRVRFALDMLGGTDA